MHPLVLGRHLQLHWVSFLRSFATSVEGMTLKVVGLSWKGHFTLESLMHVAPDTTIQKFLEVHCLAERDIIYSTTSRHLRKRGSDSSLALKSEEAG